MAGATSGALLGESLVWWDIDFTEGEKGEDWLREKFGLFLTLVPVSTKRSSLGGRNWLVCFNSILV